MTPMMTSLSVRQWTRRRSFCGRTSPLKLETSSPSDLRVRFESGLSIGAEEPERRGEARRAGRSRKDSQFRQTQNEIM